MHLTKRAIFNLGLLTLLSASGAAQAGPPALPPPVYTGATHAAAIDKATAPRVVDNLFLATTLAQLYMQELPLIGLGGRAQGINQTVKGPLGGSALVQG